MLLKSTNKSIYVFSQPDPRIELINVMGRDEFFNTFIQYDQLLSRIVFG